jgi:methionine-S-sulfoxide reductase
VARDNVDSKDLAMTTAIFAAGCFWGVEERFAELPGVTATEVGYTGGSTPNPTYRQVCSHKTGHAEAVRLTYDPDRITYEDLLAAFFAMHDPTTRDRQGPDVGSQYRSAVFVLSAEQDDAAREYVRRLEGSGRYSRPVVTQIERAGDFWRAEQYHQRYLKKHGRGSCAI